MTPKCHRRTGSSETEAACNEVWHEKCANIFLTIDPYYHPDSLFTPKGFLERKLVVRLGVLFGNLMCY